MNNMKEETNSNNANVDSGLKALEVPRLDRASEVQPQAVGDSIGLDPSLNPVNVWAFEFLENDKVVSKYHIKDNSVWPSILEYILNRIMKDNKEKLSSDMLYSFRITETQIVEAGKQ